MKMPLEDTLIIKNLLFLLDISPFGTFILPIVGEGALRTYSHH